MSAVPQHVPNEVEEHSHPGWQVYARIAVILTIITAIEVATYYIDIGSLIVWVLLVLSAVKFAIVVGYYMHLKFDNRFFTYVFVFGFLVGLSIVVSFLALFDRLG
jgi:cytochrome c oxidase subunit 4